MSSGYDVAFVLVSTRQNLLSSSASTGRRFDGDLTSSSVPKPSGPSASLRSVYGAKPRVRSGSCSSVKGTLEFRLRSSPASRAAAPLRNGRRYRIRTLTGSTNRRTCPAAHALKRADSSVFACQTAPSERQSNASKSRHCSTKAGSSTILSGTTRCGAQPSPARLGDVTLIRFSGQPVAW